MAGVELSNSGHIQFREIGGIRKFTLLPSSISTGLLQREKKTSFLELEIGSTLWSSDFLWEIKTSQSVGRNLSHTKSDWAAALNIRETAADLQTSIGLVRDKRLAITPSGIKDKSPSSSPSVSILLSYSIASFALGPQAIRGLFFSFFFFFLV